MEIYPVVEMLISIDIMQVMHNQKQWEISVCVCILKLKLSPWGGKGGH